MPVANDPLLKPFQLKQLTLRNRIMSTSHACGLEEEDGMPARTYQRYHVEKARGGLALTMFGGSSYVDRDSTWPAGQLNVGTDRIIPYLRTFSERVHAEGAAIMIQITHLGRRGESAAHGWLPTVAPSVVRETGHRSFPRAMDQHDIQRIVTAFGDAARRCREGGLDGLEVMVGGHLIGQFLSPATNRRTDEFGGSLENRCRFGLLVLEEIRRRVDERFIVGMRVPIEETMADGLTFEDCVTAARLFQQSGLVDFFNANYGRLDTELSLAVDCMPGMASPIAPWLEKVGAFKAQVGVPVFHAARITDLASARHAIREGLLDMVAMTRAHIADPHIVNKIMRGEEQRIRPCVGATHCMSESRPTCLHNAAAGRERLWPQVIERSTSPERRVVVVGGGPAGLEAARVSAERGHRVVLFEAADALGGKLRMATRAGWRGDVAGIVDWRRDELQHLHVDVRLNLLAEAGDVTAETPDVVIVATGGLPDLDWLDGAEHCTSIDDLLSGSVAAMDDVVVYDGTGRHPAATAVDWLHGRGAATKLALLDDRPGAELTYAERVIWKRELARKGIPILSEHRLVKVRKTGNRLAACFVHELTDQERVLEADQVVVEHGTVPADALYQALRSASRNDGVTDIATFVDGQPQPVQPSGNGEDFVLHRIGDALASRNVAAAVFDALRLCCVM